MAKDYLQPDFSILSNHNMSIDVYISGEVNRSFSPADNQCWSDETAIVFDVFERLIGYTYFGIIDHDEFLIPSRNRSLKQFVVSNHTRIQKVMSQGSN